ncbi:unnamed protein product [Protopolystoma xenopodis]|uniref:Uncharacterized protein n=1 Tax=Protopolystoma xenopodis TaxID=117903 RepID=A0A448WG02_9PLAT|nr:unnamed protein product [Protopolystoma xenopodis]
MTDESSARIYRGRRAVLPPLIDVLPEARLNLIIYHLKNEDIRSAYELVRDIDPGVPMEYVLKAIVNAGIGQEHNSREHLRLAQQYFQLVGASVSECDTLTGRQCMSSCFFILRQFKDVVIYLKSIKNYFYNDDTFNFLFAQPLEQSATRNSRSRYETMPCLLKTLRVMCFSSYLVSGRRFA